MDIDPSPVSQMIATQTIGTTQASKKRRLSRILVVEDCPTQALQLQGILTAERVEVDIALDAESALLLLDTAHFDMVIADIGLPGMSGIELCDQVKNHPRRSELPVILITS